MTKIGNLLLRKQEKLLADLKECLDIDHPTGKGDSSEESWRQFLSSILPNKYKITKGYVIDSEGNESEQMDIIIYDALYSPLIMTTKANEMYIPSEAVYAVAEVKQTINKAYLEYAHNKIESVKRLYRSSRGMISSGKKLPPRPPTKIIGMILATNMAIKESTLKRYLYKYNNIDISCAINNGTYYLVKDDDTNNIMNIKNTSGQESVLGLFFYLQNELHKIGTVAAIDIRKYANALDSFDFNTEEEF